MLPLLILACTPAPTDVGVRGCEAWTVLYPDVDRDGFGDPALPTRRCALADGWVVDATDCDDTRADVNPAGVEVCGAADEDCDGAIDDVDDDVAGRTSWFVDADGDGYGVPGDTVSACAAPPGTAAVDTDCDDASATTHPDRAEACDGVDTDCDPLTDEAGLASFLADGVVTDVTAWFGTAAAPAEVALTAGALTLCGGTWYAHLTTQADLTLSSPDGAVLDGGGSGTVLSVDAASVNVSGLTIQGGRATGAMPDGRLGGGGLRCTGGGTVYLLDTSFVGNTAEIGGAIASDECWINLRGGTLSGNDAEEGGAGWFGDGHVEIERADLVDNHASVAGGALLYDPAGSVFGALSDFVIEACEAPEGAGLVLRGDAELQIYGTGRERAGLLGNTSERGGALRIEGDAMAELIRADLGEPGTADDNTPADVTTAAGDEQLGDDLLGWCWSEGCSLLEE